MAEISRNKPSDVTAIIAPKGHNRADLCALDDGEPTFRDAVRQANETAKKPEIKKQTQSNAHTVRKPTTGTCQKPQDKPTTNVISNKPESPTVKEDNTTSTESIQSQDIQKIEVVDLQVVAIDPKMQVTQNNNITDEDDLEDLLSDLDLIEHEGGDEYTADDYIINTEETDILSSQDKPEVVIFANALQIAEPHKNQILTNNESATNDELQNQTTGPDVQPVQPGVSRQNMHESSERHISEKQPDIELSAEEQKIVDAFVRTTKNLDSTQPNTAMNIVTEKNAIPQAEMKRSLVVPIQFVSAPQSEAGVHDRSDNSTHQVDPISNANTAKSDKGHQESMNFSQFSGSSSDMKNMAETSKVSTHNLVSTNPAAEFIETLKQNFKQFGKVQTSKLTVQMRHSGKNLTIHFNTDADQVMNVTFRTTDTDWKNMLQENSQKIEDIFEDSNHTVKIYLGENV